jgi:hypothetical protein
VLALDAQCQGAWNIGTRLAHDEITLRLGTGSEP